MRLCVNISLVLALLLAVCSLSRSDHFLLPFLCLFFLHFFVVVRLFLVKFNKSVERTPQWKPFDIFLWRCPFTFFRCSIFHFLSLLFAIQLTPFSILLFFWLLWRRASHMHTVEGQHSFRTDRNLLSRGGGKKKVPNERRTQTKREENELFAEVTNTCAQHSQYKKRKWSNCTPFF